MSKRIHLICNAHIDPIWQWDWPEGVSATLSTFHTAVRLAEHFDYIFCHNEVTVYQYVEEYAPALFERIRALVKAGKWHIMGGWFLQPDCNLPSGESFVRQIREGQRYFKEKFGVFSTTATNFDPFGHTVGLVQIIKKCGQDSYLFMRPYAHECALPASQFIWRGPDGSEIKAVRTGAYNTHLGKSAREILERATRQSADTGVVLWGVGNHGGGPSFKDLEDIERELLPSEEIEFLHSTPEAFFREIAPTACVDSSLRISMPGCYTTMHRVKRLHAMLENELYLAEKLASVAWASGALAHYPEEELRRATHDLLNAEFHDVLPGTTVQCGEEGGIRYLDHGILEAERVKIRAFMALSGTQPVAGEGEFPIIVFNPHPYPLEECVECEFSLADQNWSEETVSRIRLLDESGAQIPCQVIKEESNLTLDWRKRIIFRAPLRPLALTRFRVYIDFCEKQEATRSDCIVFDNGHKRVEIDRRTGLLACYRIDGVDYVRNGFEPVSFDDNADPWAMGKHQLARLGTNERSFTLSDNSAGIFRGLKNLQVTEDGEIYLGVEAFFEQDCTRVRVAYKIYKDSDDVDVEVRVFLGDVDRIVKLKIPFLTEGHLIGQTAYATEPLFEDARENVAHRFVALEGGERFPALLNTDVYGSHFENNTLYMSLVRGVTYCAHPIGERPLLPSDRFTKKIDQGESVFSFRLTVTDRASLERRAQAFTQKPYGLNLFPIPREDCHPEPFAVWLDGNVSCTAIKKADGRDAILFRLFNNNDTPAPSALEVNGVRLALHFGKYEVKTVLWENGALCEVAEMII